MSEHIRNGFEAVGLVGLACLLVAAYVLMFVYLGKLSERYPRVMRVTLASVIVIAAFALGYFNGGLP